MQLPGKSDALHRSICVGVDCSGHCMYGAGSGASDAVHVTGLGPKGAGEDRSRFVTVWKLVNAEWKVAHDIGSTTMPDTTKK